MVGKSRPGLVASEADYVVIVIVITSLTCKLTLQKLSLLKQQDGENLRAQAKGFSESGIVSACVFFFSLTLGRFSVCNDHCDDDGTDDMKWPEFYEIVS